MSKRVAYTVTAYRWGDRNMYSYVVGVYSKKHSALKAAQVEKEYRGGKYECEVIEWTLDLGNEGKNKTEGKIIHRLCLIGVSNEP